MGGQKALQPRKVKFMYDQTPTPDPCNHELVFEAPQEPAGSPPALRACAYCGHAEENRGGTWRGLADAEGRLVVRAKRETVFALRLTGLRRA